jgi:predicted GH43/DUF377 family glycosyl hydrolase
MSNSVQLKEFTEIIEPRNGHFDASELNVFAFLSIPQGKLVFYYVKNPFLLGAALLDKVNSKKILWRSTNPIWQTQKKILPLKITRKIKQIYFYFKIYKTSHLVKFSLDEIFGVRKVAVTPVLKRIAKNPILKPNPHNSWEASAVFNSGALYLDNKVHFIYRSITSSGESVLGYAASNDGIKINERSNNPVYHLNDELTSKNGFVHSSPSFYQSGSNSCGCEDPRLTQIGDTIYMTYTAWNAASPPFVALTSIDVADFRDKKWKWKKPIQISPHYEMHKNWVVFPEKINGQYAILHSLTPAILIQYLDTLESNEICIKSFYNPDDRDIYWDNWIRGAGPPPIKTNEGWLLLYHAMDRNDPNRYKIGAMILDLQDPTKVLYRSGEPLLEPDAIYENQGHKSGVVYACGAVVINDNLFVYYGGADTVLCAAKRNLNKLLSGIKNSQMACTFS